MNQKIREMMYAKLKLLKCSVGGGRIGGFEYTKRINDSTIFRTMLEGRADDTTRMSYKGKCKGQRTVKNSALFYLSFFPVTRAEQPFVVPCPFGIFY